MPINSAGLMGYKRTHAGIQILLVHPGGPFWAKRDLGAWSIPKGEIADGEPSLDAAKREFHEETGLVANGPFQPLGAIKQSSAKTVHVWAVEGDWDLAKFRSNQFTMEWPPRSGRIREFPEADRLEWFSIDAAREKILKGQLPLLDRLQRFLDK